MSTTVAARVALSLAAGGVRAAFGVPGGQTVPYYQALEESSVRHVLMRDERSAAYAADAYARITRTVGVCDATVGPGTTNLVSGLAEAYASSSPILAVIADIERRHEHLRRRGVASQAIDQRALLEPVVKWVGRVSCPEAVDGVMDQALRIATTGRPGPVVVEIPDDILRSTWDAGDAGSTPFSPETFAYPRFRNRPLAADCEHAAQLLVAAERPMIIAGGGAQLADASVALTALSERHGIPVATTLGGKGVVDESSQLALGVTGVFGVPRANAAVWEADAILILGSKMSQFSTHGWRSPRASQTLIHVDVDGEEIGRTVPVALGICADAAATVEALAVALAEAEPHSPSWISRLPSDPPGVEAGATDGPMRPQAVAQALSDALSPDDVLVCDASLASGWGSQHYVVKRAGRSFLAPRGLAGTGWSGGASIGARAAVEPDRRVVVLVGDGAWGYGMAEVETAVRMGGAIVYVVLNNGGLGWIKHIQDKAGGQPSTYGDVDFAAAARAMGASGSRVSTGSELDAALAAALTNPGSTVIDVSSSIDESPVQRLRSASATGAYG